MFAPTMVFTCTFYKSQNGVRYPANAKLNGAYVWRAEAKHPHYTVAVYAYALSKNEAYASLFDKWSYLLNRGVEYPRHLTSPICGNIVAKKSKVNPKMWEATVDARSKVRRDVPPITAYGAQLELAVERLENAYTEYVYDLDGVHDIREEELREVESQDDEFEGGYTLEECDGEPGVNGDSEHKPDETLERLNKELNEMVAARGKALLNDGLCSKAAAKGNLHLLMRLRMKGCPWDAEYTTAYAAQGGHLHIVKWAIENGAPWNAITMSWAVLGGNLSVVKYLFSKGYPWNVWACYRAALGGHLHVLKWLRNPTDEVASELGKTPLPCPWDRNTPEVAAYSGHLDVLKWAIDNGCPANVRECYNAAKAQGHKDIVKYLAPIAKRMNIEL